MMKMKALYSKVVGVTAEGRQDVLEMMNGDEVVQLRPEPQNKYDENAIAVWVAFPPEAGVVAMQIRYLPKEIAAQCALHMDGEFFIGEVEKITGGFTKHDGTQASLGCEIRVEIPDGN